MADDVITFKGVTIFTSASTGIGWSFKRGGRVQETTVVGAILGTGYWLKPGNISVVSHSLELAWLTSSPDTIRATVEALATYTTGDLVLPIWSTVSRCRLSDVGDWDTSRSDGSNYILKTTLSFEAYP